MRFYRRLVNFLLLAALTVLPVWAADPCAAAPSSSSSRATQPVKNLILLIGDGMGFQHIQAASYYTSGEAASQVYNSFPVQLGMSTYPAGGYYTPEIAWSDFSYVTGAATDSAAAATALSTGGKTISGAIGVDANGVPLRHAVEIASQVGKASGIVTSVQISHATPAGFAAHNLSRSNYVELANELIYTSTLQVLIGSGHPCYDDDGNWNGCTGSYQYIGGETTWSDLADGEAAGADTNGDGVPDPWTVVETAADFQGLASGAAPARLLGLVQVHQTLQQKRSGDLTAAPYVVPPLEDIPTLSDLAVAALNVLEDDPDGFFLMIEGGAIDWASHANQAGRMLEEQVAFDAAVQAVVDWVETRSSWEETLVIVTADHETGYLNGPGSDPTWEPLVNNGPGSLPGLAYHSQTHTNSLVPVFARGLGDHLLLDAAQRIDPQRGPFLDNTDLGQVMIHLLSSVPASDHLPGVYFPLLMLTSSR